MKIFNREIDHSDLHIDTILCLDFNLFLFYFLGKLMDGLFLNYSNQKEES